MHPTGYITLEFGLVSLLKARDSEHIRDYLGLWLNLRIGRTDVALGRKASQNSNDYSTAPAKGCIVKGWYTPFEPVSKHGSIA